MTYEGLDAFSPLFFKTLKEPPPDSFRFRTNDGLRDASVRILLGADERVSFVSRSMLRLCADFGLRMFAK